MSYQMWCWYSPRSLSKETYKCGVVSAILLGLPQLQSVSFPLVGELLYPCSGEVSAKEHLWKDETVKFQITVFVKATQSHAAIFILVHLFSQVISNNQINK